MSREGASPADLPERSPVGGEPRPPVRGEASAKGLYGGLLDRLGHLAETLGTARDLITIFRALRDFAAAEMPFSGVFISLHDPERSVRRAVYAWSEGDELDLSALPPMPMSESPHSRAVATGQVVITDDFQAAIAGQPRFDVGFEVDPRPPRSSLAAPMSVMGRIVGGVEVQSCDPAAFNQGHATIMRLAANLAAIAVENVRLLDRERRARATAEEASRLKDEFLAVLSHELRTPLTSILGWARLLRTRTFDQATSARALETVERNARAQVRLVDDLLDVSRIVTGKLRLDFRPLELAPVITSAIETVRPAAEAKGLRIDCHLGTDVGPVLGDPNRLQQIVWNLLSNAIKFTPAGGRVEVHLDRVGTDARVLVSDTGQGIDPEFLPHVFDRFRQADSKTTRAQGGLGIGLAIVRNLVELHGGTVQAHSPGAGQGTSVTMTLPLLASHPVAKEPRETASGREPTLVPPASSKALEGLKVLIVDDEADARELFAFVLTHCGAIVSSVPSAREAVKELQRLHPDVLVSDIGMPDEDGYTLIRKVRALAPQQGGRTPALAVTAHTAADDRLRALSAGYQRYLQKPVDPSELVSAIAGLRARRDSR